MGSPRSVRLREGRHFGVRQLTGSGDLPPEILKLITEAAPKWSAFLQSHNAN